MVVVVNALVSRVQYPDGTTVTPLQDTKRRDTVSAQHRFLVHWFPVDRKWIWRCQGRSRRNRVPVTFDVRPYDSGRLVKGAATRERGLITNGEPAATTRLFPRVNVMNDGGCRSDPTPMRTTFERFGVRSCTISCRSLRTVIVREECSLQAKRVSRVVL